MKMLIKDVLIFKTDNQIEGLKHPTEVTFKNPLPVTINFTSNPVGIANLRQIGNEVFADFEIQNESVSEILSRSPYMYPYVGGQNEDVFEIRTCSLGGIGNTDTSIPMINSSQIEIIETPKFNPRILNEK